MKPLRLLLILLFCTNVFTVWAQTTSGDTPKPKKDDREIVHREFDQGQLEEFLTNEDFNYEEVPPSESIWNQILNWIFSKISRILMTETGAFAYDVFLYFITAAVVIYIILRYNQISISSLLSRSARKIRPSDFTPDDISDVDFDQLIGKATAKGDYRSAVRYLYLKLLQDLQTKEMISWRPDYTNQDYVNQLAGSGLAASFQQVTFYFDNVFYGHYPVHEQNFERARGKFEEFYQQQP